MSLAAVCAVYNLGWGLFHLTFWPLLRWKEQLARLSPTNRGVVQILNLCLTWLFLVIAYIYMFHPTELINSGLGRALAYGVLFLWVGRTVEQVIFMEMRRRLHQLLLVLFAVGVGIHGLLLWT